MTTAEKRPDWRKCEKADEGVNVKAYEYENAIHVTLPSLDQSSVELVGMREANRPDLRRAIYGRSALYYYYSWSN